MNDDSDWHAACSERNTRKVLLLLNFDWTLCESGLNKRTSEAEKQPGSVTAEKNFLELDNWQKPTTNVETLVLAKDTKNYSTIFRAQN